MIDPLASLRTTGSDHPRRNKPPMRTSLVNTSKAAAEPRKITASSTQEGGPELQSSTSAHETTDSYTAATSDGLGHRMNRIRGLAAMLGVVGSGDLQPASDLDDSTKAMLDTWVKKPVPPPTSATTAPTILAAGARPEPETTGATTTPESLLRPSSELVADTAAALAGMVDGAEQTPPGAALGYALISFDTPENRLAGALSSYALRAVRAARAITGEQIGNFVAAVSAASGLSATAVAWMAAGDAHGITPAIALGMYELNQDRRPATVSDTLAMRHWLAGGGDDGSPDAAMDARFLRILQDYPKHDELEQVTLKLLEAHASWVDDPAGDTQLLLKSAEAVFRDAKHALDCHIIDSMGPATIEVARRDLRQRWGVTQKSERLNEFLGRASIASGGVSAVATTIDWLGRSAMPGMSAIGRLTAQAVPWLQAAITTAITYEAYTDLRSPRTVVPLSAKALTVLRACCAAGTLGLSIVAALGITSGAMFAGIAALGAAAFTLGIAKARLIRRHVRATHSIDTRKLSDSAMSELEASEQAADKVA